MYNNNGYCLGNERYPAVQNDYLSDDRVPSSHAQALAMVHDNPQDVRIECMLYNYITLKHFSIRILIHDMMCTFDFCFRTTITTRCTSLEYLYQQQ